MRNAILRELMTEYEQLRAADAMEEERRRREVAAKCPEIAALLEERQQLIFRGVRSVLAGQSTADNLPQQMEVLSGQISRLLKQNGYAADYLDRIPLCPVQGHGLCRRHGTGDVRLHEEPLLRPVIPPRGAFREG